jgi:hypothetical protein
MSVHGGKRKWRFGAIRTVDDPATDIAMCQQMSGTDINTAAAISTYDQTNIDGGSISHPEWPRDFSSVGLQGLQPSIPGLISRSQPIFVW